MELSLKDAECWTPTTIYTPSYIHKQSKLNDHGWQFNAAGCFCGIFVGVGIDDDDDVKRFSDGIENTGQDADNHQILRINT